MREPEQRVPEEPPAEEAQGSVKGSQAGSLRSFTPRLSAAHLVSHGVEHESEFHCHAAVEAVVVGHLPTRAGPWVAQYARSLCEQLNEPVALVRLAGDRLSLDVIGIGLDEGGQKDPGSFEDAVRSVGERVGAWLVSASDLGEAELCLDPRVSRVTLLCTNDDSGVLATYRTIRQLLAWDRMPRSIAVAPLGVEVHQAESLWTRLREATGELLGGALELSAFVERMGPTGAAAVYWTDTPESLERVLDAIDRTTNQGMRVARRAVRQRDDAGGANEPADASHPVPAHLVPTHHGPPTPAGGGLGHGPGMMDGVGPGGGGVLPGRSSASASSPDGAVSDALPPALDSSGSGSSGLRPGLAGGGDGESIAELIPGVWTTGLRCPIDPAVELGLDASGRVQLVLIDAPESAGYRLHAAARWLRVNGALVGAAVSRADVTLEPTLHLVVRGGRQVEPALAADWRVHLLIERQADGMTMRVLEPLRDS